MTLDVLLLRARGDNTDSIRVQAQESIRQIMSAFNAQELLPRFSVQQRQQLSELVNIQEEIKQA